MAFFLQISDPDDYRRKIVVPKFGEKKSLINSFLQCVLPNRLFRPLRCSDMNVLHKDFISEPEIVKMSMTDTKT